MKFGYKLAFLLLILLTAITSAWTKIGIGYSDPFTIDRRVKPVITGLEPPVGSTKGGTIVTVEGDKFYAGQTTVKLNQQSITSVTISSATQLSFKTPASNAGLVDFEVFNPNGVSAKLSQAFKYEAQTVKTMTVTPASQSLVANGTATMTVVVSLLDQSDQPIADETVNLLADRGTVSPQAINNKDGTYTAAYKASQTAGMATITAVTNTTGKVGEAQLTLTARKVSAHKSTAALGSKWAMIGGEGAKLSVKVLDQQGLAMADQTVTVVLEPADNAIVTKAASTDAAGQTRLTIQSTQEGERQITVKVGDTFLKESLSVNFTSSQVTAAEIMAGGLKQVGELVKVKVTLLNADTLPVTGQKMELIVEPATGVIITQPQKGSDGQGQLEIELLSQKAGLKTVKIKVGESILDNSAAIIFQAGPVDKVKINADKGSLLPQQTAVLTITVTDQYDNPLKGNPVEIESTLGQVSAMTDKEDGTYTAIFTAPTEKGSAILTVMVAGETANLGLLISDKPPLTISPRSAEVEIGQTIQFEASQPVIWTTKGNIGAINNQGLFTANQIGATTISALLTDDPTIKVSSQTITVVRAKLPATTLVFDLPIQVQFGTELDIKGQLLMVDQPDTILSNQPILVAFVSPSQKSLKFSPQTNNEGRYALDTVVQFNEVGVWQLALSYVGSTQSAATQRQQAISVSKASSTLKWLSAENAELGQDYLLVGALQPAVAATEIALQILGPDARLIEQQLVTDASGGFKHQFKLELDGRWSATVSWAGNANYQAVTETFQLRVIKRFGKVIIGLGGAGPTEVHAWPKLKSIAESVYKTFVSRNFNPQKDIYFLSSDPTLTAGADAQTTLKTLEFAITNWAAKEVDQNVPLYIYLLSHNLGDKFLVEKRGLQDDYLTSQQLDLWLDKLPEKTPVTLIIEACYSGNFINPRLSAPNRTIITSVSADKQAMIMRSSSFSRFFFDRIGANQTIERAFSQTKEWMDGLLVHQSQRPQIDVNGNGTANELLDLQVLGDRRIPADIPSLSLPPAFGQQVAAVTLEVGNNSHSIEVEVVGGEVESVTAEVIQPDFNPNQTFVNWQQMEQQIQIVKLQPLKTEGASNRYQLKYDQFNQVGDYTIIFQAKNVDGYTQPIQTTVTVSEASSPTVTQLKGDVNSDGSVNIFDLVITAGQFGQTSAGLMGDVNNDGTVNIFDLVIVASSFGQSAVAAAPVSTHGLTLSTTHKQQIGLAIQRLSSNSARSAAEELTLNLLQAILPRPLPSKNQLLANYPNPFNPETWIPFQLAEDSEITITIYDLRGQPIRRLPLGQLMAGRYEGRDRAAYWDGRTEDGELVASGTYFYRLNAGKYHQTRKMAILK